MSTAYHLLSGSRAARLLLNWLIDWLNDWLKGLCSALNRNKLGFESSNIYLIIIIIIIITTTIFIVLSSWPGHCESSLGSSGECGAAPSGRRSSDQATWLGLRVRLFWAASVYSHHRHLLLLLSPKADTHLPSHVNEGWGDLNVKATTKRWQRRRSPVPSANYGRLSRRGRRHHFKKWTKVTVY